MKIKISEAKKLSNEILAKLGFAKEEIPYCTDLFIEGELVGKKSHGLIRLTKLNVMIEDGRVSVNKDKLSIVKETQVSILIDGKGKTGFYVVPKTLEMAMRKMKKNKLGMFSAGVTNTSPTSGMVGYYARKAAEEDLIFIGFNNSVQFVIPHGATKRFFGTNPITVGIPNTTQIPVIWDTSSSKISVGDLLVAKQEGKEIPGDVARGEDGKLTTDPNDAYLGGILPFAGPKGSGMAFIVELLAGALTGSSITAENKWKWGSFFILIDPTLFRPIDEFKKEVQSQIDELKTLPKAEGIEEIYYPGERSQTIREQHLKVGEFDMSDELYKELMQLKNTD